MTDKQLTILEAVRALTVGDCPTRREAVKTIRKYFENGDPVERIREEVKGNYRVILVNTSKDDWAVRWNECIEEVLDIIDKYREPKG